MLRDRIGKPAKKQGRKALGLRVVTPMIARLQDFLRRDGLQSVPLFFNLLNVGGEALRDGLCCVLFVLLLLSVGCGQTIKEQQRQAPPLDASRLVVAGSGSNLSLTRVLATEYSRQSGVKMEIPGSIGTTGAIKATREGAILLGLASRQLTPAEMSQGLKQIHYASIGLAVAVHPSVPDGELDHQTLVKIYLAGKTAWSNGAAVVALCMYEADSTNDILQKHVPGFSAALKTVLARNDWRTLYSDGAMLETLAKTPNAIGFIDAAALSENAGRVKALKFNGVEMNFENLNSGRYPLKKELFFIYRGTLADDAQRFIAFCLSEAGRQIIVGHGAIPAPRKE
jgi:phosphate transport system substrate-binding protein